MKNQGVTNLWDACCEGHLHTMTRDEDVEYKDTRGQLAIHFSVCDVCKAEISDASDLLKNKREWIRFKKKVDHIPLGNEISKMRKEHHLSQSLAASIFGGGPVAFSKYENDDLIPDESMVNLLKLAIAYPDTVRHLAKLKGIELEYTSSILNTMGTRVTMPDNQISNPTYFDLTKFSRSDSVYLPKNYLSPLADEEQFFMNEAICSAIDIFREIPCTTVFRETCAVDTTIPAKYKIRKADPIRRKAEFTPATALGNFKLEPDSITHGAC